MNEIHPQETQQGSGFSPMFQTVVRDMSRDMKFVGIFSIIFGALECITIVGALIGVPLIFAGIRLREAADSFLGFLNSNDAAALEYGFERQKRFFFIYKVLIIVSIVLMIFYFVVIIGIIGTAGMGIGNYY